MRPAEPGVPHRRLVLAGALDFVLVVQQSQVDPDLGHFRMDVRPVELLEHALAHVPFRVEQAVDLLFAQVLDLDPRDSPLVCDVEHLEDAAHGHMPGLGDRPPRHALVAELHDELHLYHPCHVDSPSVDRLHGKQILRKGQRDTETAERVIRRQRIREMIGDTENAKRVLSRARNTQFDHKKAISDPLTEVCADAIRMNLSQKQTTANRNNQKNRN